MANAEFVNQIYQTALSLGIPEVQARLAASQAALETNFGKSAPGNNFFGIKGPGQTLRTKEASNGALKAIDDSFKTYPDLESSILGWYSKLQSNWPDAATATNFGTAIDALNNGRYGAYATDQVEKNDPLTYQDKLASINRRYLGGGPLPPANIPGVGSALDTSPPGTYTIRKGDTLGQLASRFGTTVDALAQSNGIADPNRIRAGATLRLPAPNAPTFAGMPSSAMYGVGRLVPGQKAALPEDFIADTGSPDLRALGMTGLSRDLTSGLGVAGGAFGSPPPLPIPRPVATQAHSAPQAPTTPVPAPSQPSLRLASGKTIQPGIYTQPDGHSVMVSDAGDGTAKIERIRGPGAIPGVLDPLREVNAPTIAGGAIRNMLPTMVAENASFLVPTMADNAKAAALNAAATLGRSAQGFGSNIFGGLGGLFGGGVPASRGLLAAALPMAGRAAPAAPTPLPRPLVLSIPSGGGNGGGTHWDARSGSWVGGGQ